MASHARAAVACAQQFKCREGSNRHCLNDDECRAALDLVLKAREPYPAFSVDRQWTMIASHGAVAPLLGAVDAALLKPPVNVMRLSLHPHGLAPQIINLGEWRAHLLDRLRQQWRVTRDRVIDTLHRELNAYPSGVTKAAERNAHGLSDEIAVPLRLRTSGGVLPFLSTITVFGTPVEITLSELSLEAFYPADEATAAAMQALRMGQR